MFKKYPTDIQPDWYNIVNIYNIGLIDLNNGRFPFLSVFSLNCLKKQTLAFKKLTPIIEKLKILNRFKSCPLKASKSKWSVPLAIATIKIALFKNHCMCKYNENVCALFNSRSKCYLDKGPKKKKKKGLYFVFFFNLFSLMKHIDLRTWRATHALILYHFFLEMHSSNNWNDLYISYTICSLFKSIFPRFGIPSMNRSTKLLFIF